MKQVFTLISCGSILYLYDTNSLLYSTIWSRYLLTMCIARSTATELWCWICSVWLHAAHSVLDGRSGRERGEGVAVLVWRCVWRWQRWYGGVCGGGGVGMVVCVWRWRRWYGGVCGGGSVGVVVCVEVAVSTWRCGSVDMEVCGERNEAIFRAFYKIVWNICSSSLLIYDIRLFIMAIFFTLIWSYIISIFMFTYITYYYIH